MALIFSLFLSPRALESDKYNHITATYFLLAERTLRERQEREQHNQIRSASPSKAQFRYTHMCKHAQTAPPHTCIFTCTLCKKHTQIDTLWENMWQQVYEDRMERKKALQWSEKNLFSASFLNSPPHPHIRLTGSRGPPGWTCIKTLGTVLEGPPSPTPEAPSPLPAGLRASTTALVQKRLYWT